MKTSAAIEQVVGVEEIVVRRRRWHWRMAIAALEAAGSGERTSGPPFATGAIARPQPLDPTLNSRPEPPDMPSGLRRQKVLGTFWFRSIFPRLSPSWRERLLETLATSVVIPNHVLWRGRQAVHLADASYDELKEIAAKTTVNGAARTDLQLLLAIASLWGDEARRRLRFVEVAARWSARIGALLDCVGNADSDHTTLVGGFSRRAGAHPGSHEMRRRWCPGGNLATDRHKVRRDRSTSPDPSS